MTDKPRGRIRSALLDALAPPADDLAAVRPDSDTWSTPAGVAPGADLERVQDADLSARVQTMPFETYLEQQPRADRMRDLTAYSERVMPLYQQAKAH